jgi:50S ribosomal protein L16 3-hydroxylase
MPDRLTHLGAMPVARFMREYWQRKPLLIRQGFTDFRSPVTPAALFALARRADVESRLVTALDGRWRLQHGPLARLPAQRRSHWSVLVQGVDLHDAAAAALRARFRFVPDARLDDLMVSYATDGGGVGPHVDSYDVFLLQAQGRRRWRISRQKDLDCVPGLPLRILADFRASAEWVLEPGDMLYLPPGVAHEGVAVGSDCITCSIGFRAPRYRELLDPWLDVLAERAQLPAQYRDPGLRPTKRPGQLPRAMVDSAHHALARLRPTAADAAQALLTVLTEPKDIVVFDPPARLPAARFLARAKRAGLVLDRRSRLLYDGAWFGINGEVFRAAPQERVALARLADSGSIKVSVKARSKARIEARIEANTPQPSTALAERLLQWYHAGWLHFAQAR